MERSETGFTIAGMVAKITSLAGFDQLAKRFVSGVAHPGEGSPGTSEQDGNSGTKSTMSGITNARQKQGDDHEWADRSRHWSDAPPRSKDKRRRRQRREIPLILAGHGVSLRMKPARSLSAMASPTIRRSKRPTATSKATPTCRHASSCWTAAAALALTCSLGSTSRRCRWSKSIGPAKRTVVSGDSFAANRERVAWQTETRSDRRKRMEFCNALIARKIEGCIRTLEESLRRSHAWDRAMKRAKDDLVRLANDPPETVNELRLLEAQSAVAYFRAWYATSLYGAHPHAIQFPTNGEPLARASPEFTPPEVAMRHIRSTRSSITPTLFFRATCKSGLSQKATIRCWASCTRTVTMQPPSFST